MTTQNDEITQSLDNLRENHVLFNNASNFSSSEINIIGDIIDDFYLNSVPFRELLDVLAFQDRTLTISRGNFQASFNNTEIFIQAEPSGVEFINENGVSVPISLERGIIHELVHAVYGLFDPEQNGANPSAGEFFGFHGDWNRALGVPSRIIENRAAGATVEETERILQSNSSYDYLGDRVGYSAFLLPNDNITDDVNELLDAFDAKISSLDTVVLNTNSNYTLVNNEGIGNSDDLIIGFNSSHGQTLIGGKGNDLIFGDANNDTLIGGAGADFLRGAGGVNTYRVGAGDTVFIQNVSVGIDEGVYYSSPDGSISELKLVGGDLFTADIAIIPIISEPTIQSIVSTSIYVDRINHIIYRYNATDRILNVEFHVFVGEVTDDSIQAAINSSGGFGIQTDKRVDLTPAIINDVEVSLTTGTQRFPGPDNDVPYACDGPADWQAGS